MVGYEGTIAPQELQIESVTRSPEYFQNNLFKFYF